MSAQRHTAQAIGLVLVAMAILPLIDVAAKKLGQQGVPVAQMVWARFFFGALFTLPFALRDGGRSALKLDNLSLNALRAACLIAGTTFFFSALRYLPIATTLSIFFVQPILITALSPLILGESVGAKRWAITFVGFAGVLIIIRPGIQPLNLGHVLALGAGLASSFYFLITRMLQGRANPIVTTFQTNAIGGVATTLAAPFFWLPPAPLQWTMLLGLALIAVIGHYFITRAYTFAEASLLSPLNYTEMVTSVAFGWLFFSDFPDALTFVGVGILITCAIMVSRAENPDPVAVVGVPE
jgi:drug/metabolite transporter (DMT)-like permease